jgi:uroporphyrinogen-III decarboxylase
MLNNQLLDIIADKVLSKILNADAKPICIDNTKNIYDNLYEKTVIVRTYSAGVFYGILKQVEGDSLILNNCRRIWKWYGANNLSNMALVGVTDKLQTRISPKTQSHIAKGFIEIIPMSIDAIENLDSVSDWK